MLISAFTPCASASAVARGSAARCGKLTNVAGWSMTELMVHGMSASSCRWLVNCSVPFSVVRLASLYIATALTTFIMLLGASASRPCAGPLPLLYPLQSHGPPVPLGRQLNTVLPLLKSVSRIGLSHTSTGLLLLNHDPSHPTRSIPFGFAHDAPMPTSLVR